MSKSVISNNFLQVLESNDGITSIDIKDNHFLGRISGTHDTNFFLLEKISSTKISLRGNLITIKGNKKNRLSRCPLKIKNTFNNSEIREIKIVKIIIFLKVNFILYKNIKNIGKKI